MVSDSLVHDTIAVSYFQKRLLSVIKGKVEPKKIFYFSDGAAEQYKNRKNFANLAYHMRTITEYQQNGISLPHHTAKVRVTELVVQ